MNNTSVGTKSLTTIAADALPYEELEPTTILHLLEFFCSGQLAEWKQ